MKIKLLYLICLASSLSFAQSISTFNSVNMSTYAAINPAVIVDDNPSGVNAIWNFTNLSSSTATTDTYASPSATETTNYPGTTLVYTNTVHTTSTTSKIYMKEALGVLSLTGASSADLELNYVTDNAVIGAFPLSYGYTNSDPVAGTFTSPSASGTFTGVIISSVDAYGTLNMNDIGAGAYSGMVTRLNTVQALQLNIFPFGNVGTATQTTNNYYDNNNGNLVFRKSVVNISVPLLSMNETTTVSESLLTNLLRTDSIIAEEKAFNIFPNPVIDTFSIHTSTPVVIESISVSDINGRQLLHEKGNITSLNISPLPTGMYFIRLQTKAGSISKKIIKN
ncbi:T9SS type A sorting domain-containing protein [Oceanihabitans sediminis]|uniref:T9SS C-terminal target domain-containing protein n=2 Tax=Pseudomonadati TaxID=3379134 RepID=A0A368P2U1_9FLAO|nr:T9SS type A sorting domain-containing protein [Oceanihabitans sediminis]MDX1278138.1 T9SS type A sorting domain-containing protein [Oceanihabitans sediminis]MDX1774075.1 T9SS type A sorting domain-containing protein [Oceanihabitans sediminis]RBP30884.1 putative secreted protein (Por secretion system target) [Oceanihabitans sediminis]RCU56848.1 T9SS C-terminal target domain-containing protein [Oceanihabitans sediminis]